VTEQPQDKQVAVENITAGRDIRANVRQKIMKIRQIGTRNTINNFYPQGDRQKTPKPA
jgi:hypothetical protein